MSEGQPSMPPGDKRTPDGYSFPAHLAIAFRGVVRQYHLGDALALHKLLIGCRHELVADGTAWYSKSMPGCPKCGTWMLAFGPAWEGAKP